jgi:hypothetical protein
MDKRAQRSDWDTRKQANGYYDTNHKDSGNGDDWFAEGRGQSNRQLWDEA